MSPHGGRPRASGDAAAAHDTAREVTEAAAALFCTVGYTATSTYAIADRAGVRQASIYHYFAGKDAILHALLLSTVRPSVELAESLVERADSAAARLWALCYADVVLLCDGPDNLGALYLLPEVAGDQFAEFHTQHARLQALYRRLVVAADRSDVDSDGCTALVFGLVESVILRRRARPDTRAAQVAPVVADGALRLLGLSPHQLETARRQGRDVLRDLAGSGLGTVPA